MLQLRHSGLRRNPLLTRNPKVKLDSRLRGNDGACV